MMKCDPEMLVGYVLGDLDAERHAAVESHAKDCQTCAERIADLCETLNLIRTLPEAAERPVPMSCLRAAIAKCDTDRLAERPSPIAARITSRWRWGFALAAAAAMAFLFLHFGVAVRVGAFEIALGGPNRGAAVQSPTSPDSETALAMNENAMRSLARDEIGTQVVPALVRLAQNIEDLDARQHEDFVSLQNAFLLLHTADLNEVRRNIGLIANTVNETLGGR
jgi:anti-sigma factor RsiW